MRFEVLTVRADAVREGDWVRWPVEAETVRQISYVHQESDYIYLHSEYDAYEYELCGHQPVLVWREQ